MASPTKSTTTGYALCQPSSARPSTPHATSLTYWTPCSVLRSTCWHGSQRSQGPTRCIRSARCSSHRASGGYMARSWPARWNRSWAPCSHATRLRSWAATAGITSGASSTTWRAAGPHPALAGTSGRTSSGTWPTPWRPLSPKSPSGGCLRSRPSSWPTRTRPSSASPSHGSKRCYSGGPFHDGSRAASWRSWRRAPSGRAAMAGPALSAISCAPSGWAARLPP